MTPASFRVDINGLRAIAVVGVLLFHFNVPPFSGGYVGVDIFFVISGYLMTAIILGRLERNTFSLGGFYWDRFVRIVPALVTMTAVTLAIGWFFVDPASFERMASSAGTSVVFVSNIYYALTSGYFAPAAEKIWYLHTWSLSVEWQFYLIFPFIVMLARWMLGRHVGIGLLVCAVGAAIVAGVAQHYGSSKVSSFVFYMMPFRAPEMLAGSLVFIYGRRLALPQPRLFEIAGLVMIAATLVLFTRDTTWPSFWWLLPASGTMAVMFANLGDRSVLRTEPFRSLGLWSYSIYLWHWPLIVAIDYAEMKSPLTMLAGFLCSIVLGYLSFRFVEAPTRAWLRDARWRGKASSLGGFLAFATACLAIWSTGGVPQRLPEVQRLAVMDARAAISDTAVLPRDCLGHLCTINPGHPVDTLILGDSHAQMFYPRLLTVAERANQSYAFQTLAGCPPVPGIGNRSYPTCLGFNDEVAREAFQPRYKRIVVIAAWNADFEAYSNSQICLRTGSDCLFLRSDAVALEALPTFETFVLGLRKEKKDVVLVVGQPIFPVNVPEQISRQSFWPNEAISLTDYPLSNAKKAPAGLEDAFRDLEKHGVRFVDAKAHRCDDTSCSLVDERGFSLYTDGNHLRSGIAAGMSGIDAAFADPTPRPSETASAPLPTN